MHAHKQTHPLDERFVWAGYKDIKKRLEDHDGRRCLELVVSTPGVNTNRGCRHRAAQGLHLSHLSQHTPPYAQTAGQLSQFTIHNSQFTIHNSHAHAHAHAHAHTSFSRAWVHILKPLVTIKSAKRGKNYSPHGWTKVVCRGYVRARSQ